MRGHIRLMVSTSAIRSAYSSHSTPMRQLSPISLLSLSVACPVSLSRRPSISVRTLSTGGVLSPSTDTKPLLFFHDKKLTFYESAARMISAALALSESGSWLCATLVALSLQFFSFWYMFHIYHRVPRCSTVTTFIRCISPTLTVRLMLRRFLSKVDKRWRLVAACKVFSS